jgi:hypothetical protein
MAQAGKKRTQMPGAGRRRMANNHTPGKLSPQGWQAVAKTLPASFDQARMRAGLDRIAQELMARAKRSSKKLMEECQKRAWACDYLIRKLPENQAGFIKREELMRQSEFE